MDAGIYAVKPNTLLDAIKLFLTYGFNIVAYKQSLFSVCTNKSLNQNGASHNYKFKTNILYSVPLKYYMIFL